MCGKYGNINYMIVTQDLVYNSTLSLHLGKSGKFSQNGKLSQNSKSGQNVKIYLSLNVSSSTHDCGGVVNGGGAVAAI